MGGCGILVVGLTLVSNARLAAMERSLTAVLRPVGNEVRVQAWDKAAAVESFFLGFVDQGFEVAPQSAVPYVVTTAGTMTASSARPRS